MSSVRGSGFIAAVFCLGWVLLMPCGVSAAQPSELTASVSKNPFLSVIVKPGKSRGWVKVSAQLLPEALGKFKGGTFAVFQGAKQLRENSKLDPRFDFEIPWSGRSEIFEIHFSSPRGDSEKVSLKVRPALKGARIKRFYVGVSVQGFHLSQENLERTQTQWSMGVQGVFAPGWKLGSWRAEFHGFIAPLVLAAKDEELKSALWIMGGSAIRSLSADQDWNLTLRLGWEWFSILGTSGRLKLMHAQGPSLGFGLSRRFENHKQGDFFVGVLPVLDGFAIGSIDENYRAFARLSHTWPWGRRNLVIGIQGTVVSARPTADGSPLYSGQWGSVTAGVGF